MIKPFGSGIQSMLRMEKTPRVPGKSIRTWQCSVGLTGIMTDLEVDF